MRFLNILLALDPGVGNELALERAIQLARKENARLTVCDVIDSIPGELRRLITSITPRELVDSIITERLERVEALIESVDSSGLSIDAKVLVGRTHVEIARLVREDAYDLVIKPVAGERVKRAQSVTREDRELMRHCPCPVWLVNVADLSDDGCIVAALDKPADGAISNPLNEHILQISRSIALATFRPLHVVHAWTMAGEGHLRARGTAESNREVDRMVAEEAADRMAWLRRAVYSTRSDSERIATEYLTPLLHAVNGMPSKVVPELAQELGAGLIVMGTAARSGLPGMLIGNTSEAIAVRSDSSLLVVKPPSSNSRTAPASEAAPESERKEGERAQKHRARAPSSPTKLQDALHRTSQPGGFGLWY